MSGVERPRLSVAIPAHNNAAALDLTLDSLTRQTTPAADFEVIVADNGSDPPLAPGVEKYADRLRITCLRNETDRGRAANRNLAAGRVRSDIIVFLDADTVTHPELLCRHWLFHSGRRFRPGVLIARRFEIDWAAADALRRGELPGPAMLDGYRGDMRDVELAAPHHRRDFVRAPWMYAFTHNVSVDRTSFEAVGGFDEAMVGWGGEDAELFYRIFHLHGGPPDLFEFDDEAMSYHLPHFRSWTDLFAELTENERYIFAKHPRYDIEMFRLPGFWGRNVARMGWFADALIACRREGLASASRLPAAVRDRLAGQRALVIGRGAAALALGSGSHTFDHDAPATRTNWHLIGFRTPFAERQFDVVISVDMWRFLQPDDLGGWLIEAMRTSGVVRLIATAPGPDPVAMLPVPFVGDIDFIADMLRARLDVTVERHGPVTVLTVRPR